MRHRLLALPAALTGLALLLAPACTKTGDPLFELREVPCPSIDAPDLSELYDRYFAEEATHGTGCAAGFCHGGGAGALTFGSATEFHDAVMARGLVTPGEPVDSVLYWRLEGTSAGTQMPKFGEPLEDEALQEVAAWICAGAPSPTGGGGGGADADAGPTDAVGQDAAGADGDVAGDVGPVDAGAADEGGVADTGGPDIDTSACGPVVTLSGAVQGIFDDNCVGCHSGGNPSAGMSLAPGEAYGSTVGVEASCGTNVLRVAPFSPQTSYLVDKVRGTQDCKSKMPLGGSLSEAQIQTIEAWICHGAKDD